MLSADVVPVIGILMVVIFIDVVIVVVDFLVCYVCWYFAPVVPNPSVFLVMCFLSGFLSTLLAHTFK